MIPRLVDRRIRCGSDDPVPGYLAGAEQWCAGLGRTNWHFDLVLVDDETMADLNSRFRGKDGVTDVLSFSYLMADGDGPCALAAGQSGAFVDLWLDPMNGPAQDGGESLSIGEIILAPTFVQERCVGNGWSVVSEFPLLVVHGCLHLLGWDHEQPQQAVDMRELEVRHLKVCGLEHPLVRTERDGS